MIDKDLGEQIEREAFGNKIKEIRKAEGYTRTELSRAIQIPTETIKGIENAKH